MSGHGSSHAVSRSLIGKIGSKARAWKGGNAGYTAIHLWLTANYRKEECEHCGKGKAEVSRLEWANISGKYKRDRSDYKVLCPSCHRKMDLKVTHCKNGHDRNVHAKTNKRGWIVCLACERASQKRYMEKKHAKNN